MYRIIILLIHSIHQLIVLVLASMLDFIGIASAHSVVGYLVDP